MPLEELSPNALRRTSVSHNSKSRHGTPSILPTPPSAVQSMLKTTTELGDLGRFSSGPSMLPRSGSRIQTTRVRSGSYDTSFASALRHDRSAYIRPTDRHHGPRPAMSASTLSGRYGSRSNLSSYAPSVQSRRHRRRLDPSNSPHPSIYTHRSLVTLRSQQDVHSVRSASPAGPPYRVRGPPYRASSPAYTDSRSLHTPQPGFFRAPSTGTVASSPASAYHRAPSVGPYYRGSNASYGSLHAPFAYQPARVGPFPPFAPPARIHTPRMGGSNIPRGMTGSTPSLVGIPQSPSGSTAPAYYDYTESFTEETCFSPDSVEAAQQPPLTISETIWEGVPTPPPRDAQTPFGIREGSKFYPSELPTKHNRRPSEQSKKSLKTKPKMGTNLNIRHDAERGLTSDVPQRGSNGPRMTGEVHVLKGVRRRSRSHDSNSGDVQQRDLRRTSTISGRAITSSPTSTFFAGASRSARDLAMLAARVHSPMDNKSQQPKIRTRLEKKRPEVPVILYKSTPLPRLDEVSTKQTPDWQIPLLTFRPMSFMSEKSSNSTRPRTSEAAASRKPLEIHSPVPKRPTSSQSRKRFSKILDIDTFARAPLMHTLAKQPSCIRHPNLNAVEESPTEQAESAGSNIMPFATNSPTISLGESACDALEDKGLRISGVTSHDKSTVESLLEKHIECLGLQPEFHDNEAATDCSIGRDRSAGDRQTSTDTSTTIRLTDILAGVPIMERGRPTTSASQQYSSLATLDRQYLRPRRLFASMDARVPGTIEEQSLPIGSSSITVTASRPSYGWQPLPSSSLLDDSGRELHSLTSGALGDVDTTGSTKLRVKRRSLVSTSASEGSILSTLSSDMLSNNKTCGLHKRSKSEIVARQASHQRRRIRIRLKMKTRSKTTGDLLSSENGTYSTDQGTATYSVDGHPNPALTSLVNGYAELSGDSVLPSHANLAAKLAKSPPIPTRWSSIIAAMPQPGKKSHEVTRKPSVRSHKSHRSNTSLVDPVNTTRIRKPLPRMDSVPRLGPPDFGPPLTSSELNLSLPYADIPSTIRPTLRETKSFFSDDSSAQRQRGTLRQKLHLHSLRHVMPASGISSTTPSRHSNGVILSHSCQMKGRVSVEEASGFAGNTIPMADFAYRRRKVVGKIKDWWNRQCLQRMVQNRKRKEHTIAGTVVW